MGCASSAPEQSPEPAPANPPAIAQGGGIAAQEIDVQEVKAQRLSIRYQAQEVDRASGGENKGGLDRSIIGTHTKHGMMPALRGGGAAKINQDRGVICFPFHGSFDEALFCVFDGHGPKGEQASEFCMKTMPELLE